MSVAELRILLALFLTTNDSPVRLQFLFPLYAEEIKGQKGKAVCLRSPAGKGGGWGTDFFKEVSEIPSVCVRNLSDDTLFPFQLWGESLD